MKFIFSIREALKHSWKLFTKRPWYFIALSLVIVILNIVTSEFPRGTTAIILMVFGIIASIVWHYVLLSVSLAAIDEKNDLLTFATLKTHMPTLRQFFCMIGIVILSTILIGLGLILLIIPGIYVMTRLSLSNLSLVDRKGGVVASLRYSWNITKGPVFWTIFLTIIVVILLCIIGMILFGVGILVTYPLAILLMAQLYRTLTMHQSTVIVEQPIEIVAPKL